MADRNWVDVLREGGSMKDYTTDEAQREALRELERDYGSYLSRKDAEYALDGMVYPNWLREMTRGHEDFLAFDEPLSVSVSFGKTSGLLGLLHQWHATGRHPIYYGFRNTGKEHGQSLLFGKRLSEAFPVEWAEFRKPAEYGAPPSEAQYAVVTYETCSRKGEPFEYFLETLAEYRATHKGLGPLRPSGGMRLCSAYLKEKVQLRICREMGWEQYTASVGMRADEPDRARKFEAAGTRDRTHIAPLYHLGITNAHVKRFWSEQPFTLELPENLGNCDLCFLKDEGDLAHNMLYDVSADSIKWWIDIQRKYGDFKSGADYAQLQREAHVREHIQEGLRGGLIPLPPDGFDHRRYDLLVRQERRRLADGIRRVACNCEVADRVDDEFIGGYEGENAA